MYSRADERWRVEGGDTEVVIRDARYVHVNLRREQIDQDGTFQLEYPCFTHDFREQNRGAIRPMSI